MSSTNASPLSSGAEQLYQHGLLPYGLSNSILNSATSGQLGQLANSSVALQEVGALFGNSSSSDSVFLSPEAALSAAASTADPLAQAVSNQLTSSLNAAVSQYLPQSLTDPGSSINVVG